MKKRIPFKSVLAIPAVFILASCGQGLDRSSRSGGSAGSVTNTGLQLSYLNPSNGNAPIAIPAGTQFPSDHTTATNANSGYFDHRVGACSGATLDFVFRLYNDGPNTITAGGSPISFLDQTNYTSGNSPYNSGANFSIAIQSAPSFPLVAGASTNFTVRLSMLGPSYCVFGEYGPTFNYAFQNYEMTIVTDDTTNPNYQVDLNILGAS